MFARLPAPFVDMKDQGKQGLLTLMQSLFDNIDDALFELADRAEHNAEQNMYFESMREIRIKRRGMELGFAREVDEAFRTLVAKDAPPMLTDVESSVEDFDVNSLSLVEDDELEELVAVDSMVAKAERQFQQPLRQLTSRLDTLIDNQAVTAKNNPFGPLTVCHSFIAVCKNLDLDIKAKLVLFKLFDRYVMNNLNQVYKLCNNILVNSGVLPSLEQRTQNKATGVSSNQTLDSSNDSLKQSADVFSDLQELLHQVPVTPMESASSGLVAPGHAPQIPRDTLLQLLQVVQQSLQSRLDRQLQDAMQGIVPNQVDVQQSLSTLLQKKMPAKAMSIGQVDDDAINLVAMLFQFILDDRNLAAPMKALIARLQIPIIKVAMLDKTFFSKGGHPARKLLNEIANASLGWVPGPDMDRDPLYSKVTAIVSRLLNEFDADSNIFHEVLADFVAFVEMDQRRTSLIEQRTVNAEDGKAKSEIARSKVQAALNEKVAGKSLPKVVITLLEEAWSNVLFLVYLKDGEDSSNWDDALVVVDDLLWSVEPMEDTQSRQQLLKMVPTLLANLRAGLTKIGYNPFDMNQLFTDLENIHLTQLKELNTVNLDVSRSTVKDSAAEKVKQTKAIAKTLDQVLDDHIGSDVSLEQLDQELDQQLAEFDKLADLVENAVDDKSVDDNAKHLIKSEQPSEEKAAQQGGLIREVVESLKISGNEANDKNQVVQELADDDPCLKQVDSLTMGNWVELHQDDDKKFRCRLAAVIRGTNKYIFVNRSGMKVAEFTRMSLAVAIKQGKVTTLDEGLLFDRALESVIGNLRNMKTASV